MLMAGLSRSDSTLSERPVQMTTGKLVRMLRMAVASWSPAMRGMVRSVITSVQDLGSACTRLSAASPSGAVVTSKPEPQASMVLDITAARSHFVHVVAAESDNEVPKARLLEQAIVDLRIHHGIDVVHDECWMIGDRHHDIDAATEVGTKGLGVLWGFGSHEELTAAGAHAIAREPEDLLRILAR